MKTIVCILAVLVTAILVYATLFSVEEDRFFYGVLTVISIYVTGRLQQWHGDW